MVFLKIKNTLKREKKICTDYNMFTNIINVIIELN